MAFDYEYSPSRDRGSCSTIIVGKDASATGYVLVAHNEDDYDCVIQVHKVPRIRHKPGETIRFADAKGVIPQVEETYAYQWSDFRCEGGISFADCFVNEWGVAVVSNACRPSRIGEEKPEDMGIGYGLRRLVAERARSAREAVEIAGALIEEFGYTSGRSYQFCDKNEAWVFQIPTGRRYVAKRIPDDHVYMIPNNYTIHEVDFADAEHKNCYFSKDLVEYAMKNGWYQPAVPGDYSDFDFARAYQDGPDKVHNLIRARQTWPMLLGERLEEWRPFSRKAPRKYTVAELRRLLSSHFEGTEDDYNNGYERNPHIDRDPCPLCNAMTAESSVIEFAEEPAMTCIWRAAPKPCISPYVPWYLGAKRAPKGYQWLPVTVSQDTHFAPGEEELHIDVSKAFWAFRVLQYFTEFDYKGTHETIRKSADELEAAWDAEQPAFREKCRSLLKEAPELAEELLSAYTEAQAQKAWDWAWKMVEQLGEERILKNSSTRYLPPENV